MANYYLAINNERLGPFPEEELLRNGMTSDSLVWCKGMDGWTRASDVPELAKYLESQQIPELPQIDSQYNQPQYGYDQGQYQEKFEDIPECPSNNLGWAIFATWCCAPLGIPAIVHAAKVMPTYDRGDYEGAKAHARKAKIWLTIAIIVGAILGIIYIFIELEALNNSPTYYYY